jgi:hypothetical protein
MFVLSGSRVFAERFSGVDCEVSILSVLSAVYLSTLSNSPAFEVWRDYEHLGFLPLTNLPPKSLFLS